MDLRYLLYYRCLPPFPKFLQSALQGVFCECILNQGCVVDCLLRMSNYLMLKEGKCNLIQVIPNLCERHISMNLFL